MDAGFLQENCGAKSSTRLVVVGWCLVLFSGWGYCTYRAASLADIPDSVVLLTAAILGLKLGQKVLGEKSTDTPDAPQG